MYGERHIEIKQMMSVSLILSSSQYRELNRNITVELKTTSTNVQGSFFCLVNSMNRVSLVPEEISPVMVPVFYRNFFESQVLS